jgi:hypothetical protein
MRSICVRLSPANRQAPLCGTDDDTRFVPRNALATANCSFGRIVGNPEKGPKRLLLQMRDHIPIDKSPSREFAHQT